MRVRDLQGWITNLPEYAQQRLVANLFGIFSMLALALSALMALALEGPHLEAWRSVTGHLLPVAVAWLLLTGIVVNRVAIGSLAFRPRVLRDVEKVDPSGTLLGHRLRIPVILAPIGSLQDIVADGGLAPTL